MNKSALCLALVFSASMASPALADPQNLLMQLYPNGGRTLYCRTPFAPNNLIRADFIYSKSDLLNHYNCLTAEACADNKEFQRAYNDLHNIYPADLQSILARSGSIFGTVPDNVPIASQQCPFRTSFQTFDPPDFAKGNVARAMVYMSTHYHLPIIGSLIIYQQWNRLDPPDQDELDRNKAIKALQGTSNPYVENPTLMDKLDSRSGGTQQLNFMQ